ncbi:hypothetical protein THRCLA_07703 [Thraustotheca clavata]|uniref:EF-hand domain-containing protein n=1 Tax=Thraustotheca clavata TaxID=74557 RepID=A0A1V9ZCG0_9STRA|nr:hypothetical protein THRCLA_07703 [Thraustotheca clavata]
MGKRKSKRSHGASLAPNISESIAIPSSESTTTEVSPSTEAIVKTEVIANINVIASTEARPNTEFKVNTKALVTTETIAAAPLVQEQTTEITACVNPSPSKVEQIESNQQAMVAETKRELTKEDASKIVNRAVFALIQAGVPLVRLFKPLPSVAQVALLLEKDYSISITRIEMDAFQLTFQGSDDEFNAKVCHEYVCTKVFPVELGEYQLRKALIEKATKLRGKCDINRMLNSLVSTESIVNLAAFESILVEKLAIELANWVLRCLYSRLLLVPYTTGGCNLPIVQGKVFIKALERFCKNSQFTADTVEGALRKLLTQSDLINKFREIDTDGSGTISLEECTAYLHGQHLDFPQAVIKEFLKRFDRDGDGMLGVDEILLFIRPKAQFGIQVLTPFGMFYMPAEPTEMVEQLVQRIHKRMFWLQHNHMLGNANSTKSKKMLISVDGFCIRKHFGALAFEFKKGDIVHNMLSNGELLVLMEKNQDGPPSFLSKEKYPLMRCPQLERPYSPPVPLKEPPPPPVEMKPRTQNTPQRNRMSKKPKPLELPTQVASWSSLDVKKWLIYQLKLKTIAPKLNQLPTPKNLIVNYNNNIKYTL